MNQPIKYGSVCSGIEAATVAWHPLGWQPVWFSEIEKFPSAVLKHHYPHVPNLGDMTKLNQHKIYNHEPINLLVGGTPCQSFSIAGLRGGLDDERGNLALEYCRILIAKRPQWFVWENVPGVFSSNNGKDFANILSAFTGKTVNPEGIGNAGIIAGDFYSIAWRVLDAQYFGVPQRRRRVFVVGHIGNNWRAPYAVLFERESLCRNFEAGAKARKGTAGKVEGDTDNASWWDGEQTAGTLTKHNANGAQRMPDKNNFGAKLQSCSSEGISYDAFNFEMYSGECKEISPALQKERAKDTRVYPSQQETFSVTIDCRNDKANEEISGTLQTKSNGGQSLNFINPVVQAFGEQNSHQQSMNLADVTPTLDKSKVPAICIQGSMIGRDDKNGPQGDGINNDVCFTLNTTDKHAIVYDTTQITSKANQSNPKEEIFHTLAKGADAPLLIDGKKDFQQDEIHFYDDIMSTLVKGSHDNSGHHTKTFTGSVARRLTPLECERLQGFPDNYTKIPGAKDGPRYAAIGNSMAVPVMAWIGRRIQMFENVLAKIKAIEVA